MAPMRGPTSHLERPWGPGRIPASRASAPLSHCSCVLAHNAVDTGLTLVPWTCIGQMAPGQQSQHLPCCPEHPWIMGAAQSHEQAAPVWDAVAAPGCAIFHCGFVLSLQQAEKSTGLPHSQHCFSTRRAPNIVPAFISTFSVPNASFLTSIPPHGDSGTPGSTLAWNASTDHELQVCEPWQHKSAADWASQQCWDTCAGHCGRRIWTLGWQQPLEL